MMHAHLRTPFTPKCACQAQLRPLIMPPHNAGQGCVQQWAKALVIRIALWVKHMTYAADVDGA